MPNLYHVPVTQDHLVAGHSATWQNLTGNAAVIPHEERALSRATLDTLRAEREPVAAAYAGFRPYHRCAGRQSGVDLLLVPRRHHADGRLRQRTRRRDGTADRHAHGPADLRRLLRPPDEFRLGRVDHDRRDAGASSPRPQPKDRRAGASVPCPSDVRVGKPIRVDLPIHLRSFRNLAVMTLTSAA